MAATQPWYTDCEYRDEVQCDWEQFAPSEDTARIITVLHTLEKHPERYRELTGNDPDVKKWEYREYLQTFKSLL